MKKFFIFVFICITFSACNKKSSSIEESANITVTNTSVVTLTADTVSLDITIRERGVDVDKLTDDGNIKANRVKTILGNMGIKDVATSQFRVMPYYSYTIIDKDKGVYERDNERSEYKYHEYLHTLKVKVGDADKNPELVGKAIDEVVKIKGVEIGNIRYSVADNRKANAAVRKTSAQAVVKKINSYAQGCGVKVKNIRRMHEGYYTKDSSIEALGAPATRNTFAVAAKSAITYDADEGFDDVSTQITSEKMGFTAEVDYTSYLSGRKDSTLSVSGFSEVKAQPDIAYFTFTVRLKGDNATSLASKSADIIKAICSRINAECELTSKSYSISPFFENYPSESSLYHADRANILKYYELVHDIAVCVRDFDKDNKLGRIIDLVKKDAGDNISIGFINYKMSDNSQYTDQARQGASANALQKCQIYADGAGVECTGVFSIAERSSTQDTDIDGDELYYGKSGKKLYKGSEIQNGQTVIFRDKISVRAQLTVTADI